MKQFYSTLLLLMTAACNNGPSSNPQAIASILIGGAEATKSQFAATITIKDHCTAAKVGQKLFLTAAHCVTNPTTGSLQDNYMPGGKITIISHATKKWLEVSISKTSVPPTYITKMKRIIQWGQSGFFANYWASDIALIKINEETNDIPSAKISLTNIEEGQEVILTGSGCEIDTSTSIDPSKRRLKTRPVKVLPIDENLSSLNKNINPNIVQTNIINFATEGISKNADAASLCPGDSGGPVYYYENDQYKIVGVNSYYTFSDGGYISDTNLHTRLNNSELKEWLLQNSKDNALPHVDAELIKVQQNPTSLPNEAPIDLAEGVAGITLDMTKQEAEKYLSEYQCFNPRSGLFSYDNYIDIIWMRTDDDDIKPREIRISEGYQGTLKIPRIGDIKLGEDLNKFVTDDEILEKALRALYRQTYRKLPWYNCQKKSKCGWLYPNRPLYMFKEHDFISIILTFDENKKTLKKVQFFPKH